MTSNAMAVAESLLCDVRGCGYATNRAASLGAHKFQIHGVRGSARVKLGGIDFKGPCALCKTVFTTQRPKQKYCSNKCRIRAADLARKGRNLAVFGRQNAPKRGLVVPLASHPEAPALKRPATSSMEAMAVLSSLNPEDRARVLAAAQIMWGA